jgi:hypothetical protein
VEIDLEGIEEVVQPQRFGSTHYYIADRYPNGVPNFNSGYAFTATYWQPQFISGTYSLSPGNILLGAGGGVYSNDGGRTDEYVFSSDFFQCEIGVQQNRGFSVAVVANYMYVNFERWYAKRAFGDGPSAPTLPQFKQRIAEGGYYVLNGTFYSGSHDWGLGPGRYPADVILGGSFAPFGGEGGSSRTFSRVDTDVACNKETSVSSVINATPIPSTIFPINGGVGDFTGLRPPYNEPNSLIITSAYIGPGPGLPPTKTYPAVRSELRKRIRITDVRGYDINNTLIPLYNVVPPS